MLLKGLVVSLIAAGALVIAACGGGNDARSGSSSGPAVANSSAASLDTVVEIQAFENGQAYFFSPTELRAQPGPVTVKFSNRADSTRPHTFDLKTKDGNGDIVRSDRVEPGKSLDVTFTVTEAGSYQFICLLPGHADRGQRGTLIVTAAAATPAAGAGSTSASTSSSPGGRSDLLMISLIIHIPAVTIFVGLALWDTFVAMTPGIAQEQRARMIGKTALLTVLLIVIIMVTGVYQTIENPFRSINSYSDLSGLRKDTAYGMALFIKHGFVLTSFFVSTFNRFYLAPRAGNVALQANGTAVLSQARLLPLATLLNLGLLMGALVAASRMVIELH